DKLERIVPLRTAALADALAFGRIARNYGVTAYVTTACICGNAGDLYLACRCTREAILAWQRRPAFQAALAADMVVEAAQSSAEQRLAHRRGRCGQPDEQLIARAAEAKLRPRPSDELDAAASACLRPPSGSFSSPPSRSHACWRWRRASPSSRISRRSSPLTWPKRSNIGRASHQSSSCWSQIKRGRTNAMRRITGTIQQVFAMLD